MSEYVDNGEYAPRHLRCCGCGAQTMRRNPRDRRAYCIECDQRRWRQAERRAAGAEPYRLHL